MDTTAQIIGSMFELHRIIRQRMTKAERPDDINMHQMHTLLFIREHPQITMSQLATALHISQASATPLVARLIKMKFVTRKTDTKNRKLIRLSLTKEGEKTLKRSLDFCNDQLRSIFSILSADDQKRFATILSDLVSDIHALSSSHSL